MYNFKPRRKTGLPSYLAIASCILALHFGVTPMGQDEIFAPDKKIQQSLVTTADLAKRSNVSMVIVKVLCN